MATRIWFRDTKDLPGADAAIINRAVRLSYPARGAQPTRKILMDFRMAYKPGMSATDLRTAVENEEY